MKLNKDRFIENLYCWGINECGNFDRKVIFYSWKKRAENVGVSGFLSQMYDKFSFEAFFEAREVLQKYNKKTKNPYEIWYEKKVY